MRVASEDLSLTPPASTHHWFSRGGVVVETGEGREVFVGGTLIGRFGPRDRAKRNAILMGLCGDPRIHLGKVSEAFGMSSETVRLMRRQFETEGLEAVVGRRPGGREQAKVSAPMRGKLEKMFEAGLTIDQARKKLRGRKLGRSTVGFIRTAWAARRTAAKAPQPSASEAVPVVELLPCVETHQASEPVSTQPAEEPQAVGERRSALAPDVIAQGSEEESLGAMQTIATVPPMSGGRWVQHVGSWLLIAMLARCGLHRYAQAAREDRVGADALRIALDAVAIALGLGQRCVEGVRRLATPSAGTLLRADHAPSASWVRRTLGLFAQQLGGVRIHFAMAKEHIAKQGVVPDRVIFYIDNHLRPYTGKHTIRKGWRMQDKRVLPGTSDYYVHDEDGRPVLRVAVASHDSLTDWLPRLAKLLREAIGQEAKILLAFDRGGAFASHLALLRERNFEFVTYERKPFRTLLPSEFQQTLQDGKETIGVADARANLGRGRGRVRRVALRMPDARQVNLLAVSTLSPPELYAIMRGRWRQENGFKHGVERWGINQLDGRTTMPYPPDVIIPNPARSRLDRALRIARVREGDARRQLAKLARGDAKGARWREEIQQALSQQLELEQLRPSTPTHAPLAQTELADTLVQHPDEYKIVLDTIRIGCANVESELACMIAPHLAIPAEAKRALANLFAAPGAVHITDTRITVALQPAGTKRELRAFDALLRDCNRLNLVLPGDLSLIHI